MSEKGFTRPIGTRFNCIGVELEVVENTQGPDGYCIGCYFDGACHDCGNEVFGCRGCCSDYTRTDGKDVIFKVVKS